MDAAANPRVRITLEFDVHDPQAVIRTANELVKNCWNSSLTDVYSENFLAAAVVETLLHSNPDIKAYLDYGIEMRNQFLAQTRWEDSQLPLLDHDT